jgi:hypothetical protein
MGCSPHPEPGPAIIRSADNPITHNRTLFQRGTLDAMPASVVFAETVAVAISAK